MLKHAHQLRLKKSYVNQNPNISGCLLKRQTYILLFNTIVTEIEKETVHKINKI